MPVPSVLAGVLAVLLLGTLAGPAMAQVPEQPSNVRGQVTLQDPAGDVWRTRVGEEAEPAPRVRVHDIRALRVRHAPRRVIVTVRYTALRRSGVLSAHRVWLRTPAGLLREVLVEAGPRRWAGRTRVFTRRGDLVQCRTRHAIDYPEGRVRVVVPRACLGTPARVRARMVGYRAFKDGRVDTDNPHDQQPTSRRWTPWVRRA
ncbi:MAG: hypothetical protein Q8Q02_02150 [Nocardioides sp.]|nr:hypothetical protein [Nocardioides sp.]